MAGPILTADRLQRRVARLPRVDLAHLPTPLEEVPRFAEAIGPVRVLIKRDDCTGLLLGGNKARHNEFLMADALYEGCDTVIWGAGLQSNNCRQTAAACAKLGLDCRLYLSKSHYKREIQGNLLLDYLVGAKVELVDAEIGPELDALLAAKADEARAQGKRPYVWDRSRVVPRAAISYTLCLAEIMQQMHAMDLRPDAVYVSSAGSTGAGLALGKAVLGLNCPVRSICPMTWPWDIPEALAQTANEAAALLDLPHRLRASDIDATTEYIGPGYGKPSQDGLEAMHLLATMEGILLEPTYTAKAMAALVADVRSGKLAPGSVVVFIHTGGLPAVFVDPTQLLAGIHGEVPRIDSTDANS
ncbi:1-aminocyclopropane-1-carboxylate deaminase/D-cysteine desulfhydrase [Tuwongella immobilis]|uniref:Tryptophan synthase beta chain-like PALP domain-containing protein n=1 Tax=Tuwongella immobilis TaxID=692036 RepID=A0A6C2YSG9_9BACT|nr:D-cysteine desulfhydrase family protein [Tuwongella immobilis]VIP03822.1 d-cysteine desulfhydrase : D-cysteine desulfhydrase OS=Acaryochloris marina (strain MBIC 11017) GN=AM1_1636 PE=4 SV=1: PALP [Tuwongella immobilis]VTS05011.1 d-cysteine desulfhydrase : D-cysteine desulfhydrase OS=Acaryochloris marina (strain MBIC 11017) GN=AM1_1636 PE=4 SV=1: PALP [Tuwongella immobilis]